MSVEGHRLISLVGEQSDVSAPDCSPAGVTSHRGSRSARLRSPDQGGSASRPRILVSEDIARWLLHEGDRDPARAFNDCAPHYCKLCDEATPPREQRRHLKQHRHELDRVAAQRKREQAERLRQLARLRREARA